MHEADDNAPPRRIPRGFAIYRGRGLSTAVRRLGWTSFFQDVASEMVYPLLPRFLFLLGGGPILLGAMESIAEGILAVVKGAAGGWSDRLRRRKPFVAAGYGLSALTRPLMAAAGGAWQVIALRSADRFAKGLRTAPRDALIAETSEAEQRTFAFSFHRGLDHLGAAVGPLLAASILTVMPGRLRLVFALATVPALVGWGLVQFGIRTTSVAETTGRDDSRPRWARPPAELRRPLAAFFLFSLGNASDAFLLLAAGNAGYSPLGLTLLWSGFHLVKWLASAPSGVLADRFGQRIPIFAGWVVYALVYSGFACFHGALAVAVLFAVYAAYFGLTEGAERALVVRLAAGREGLGNALGAFHLATGLGRFAASILFGVVWKLASPAAAFLLGAGLATLAALLLATAGDTPST